MSEKTYKIIRFWKDAHGGCQEVIGEGFTLDEAKAHCSSSDSRGIDWFDGFEEE